MTSKLKSKRTITVVGLAGLAGGVVVGGSMVATAANPTPVFQNSAVTCVATTTAAVPVPAVPVYTTRLLAGSSKVSGTAIPSPALFGGVTPTSYRFEITTQYNTTRSGGNKTDIATVSVPNHVYTNPLLFNIPPVTQSLLLGAAPTTTATSAATTDSVPFSVQTTGKATATATVNLFIATATSTTTTSTTVLGSTCPTGSTLGANYLQGVNTPRPATPTAVTAKAGSTTFAPTGTAPNNGDATISFTGPVADAATGPIRDYRIFVHNTAATAASAPDGFVDFPVTSASATSFADTISGLDTTQSYTFTVEALTDAARSIPSVATTPAVTPLPGTGTTAATAANGIGSIK